MGYRKKNRKRGNTPMDIDDVSDEEFNEEGEDPDSEDEYVVEKVIDHRKTKGVMQYYLKWKGYPEDDNTWENESDVFAKELIEKYWKRKKDDSKKNPKESSEDSSEDDPKENFNSKEKIDKVKKKQNMITNNQVNIRKRKFSDSFTEEPDFSLLENFPPSNLTNWEEAVDDVETVEKNPKDSGLLIYLNWKNGHRTRHPASVANIMCPQKIIRFYEEHLKFKDLEE